MDLTHLPSCFNTQPPEGGWRDNRIKRVVIDVSTHSRLKAAGEGLAFFGAHFEVSTHSRLKAAGMWRRSLRVGLRFQHTAA